MDNPSTSGSHNNATNLPIKSRVDFCFVPMCPSTSTKFPNKIFLTGPSDPKLRENWFQAAKREVSFSPKTVIRCCEDHFDLEKDVENWIKFKIFGGKLFLKKDVVPHFFECQNKMTPMKTRSAVLKRKRLEILENIENTPRTTSESLEELKETHNFQTIHIYFDRSAQVNEQDLPGPSKILDTRNLSDSVGREQDPLSRVIEQCRFCGEFSKDCVAVSSDMTYLAGNKTTLALNDTSVQLDFNHRSLPKAVCRDCDAKLQEFCHFVNVVKAAQSTLINVAEEKEEFETGAEFEETTTDFEETTADFEERTKDETETLIIKTEYDSQQEDSDDDKDGIVDSLTVGETVFVRETHKRKSDTDNTKSKKLKTKEKCGGDDYLIIDIKEEVVEKDANDGHGQSEVSDTGTDVKPSELELATSALVFEMAEEGTSEYQGYRSDR